MNAGTCRIANPNALSKAEFSTEYTAEYFELYSWPIRTRYSEVYWPGMQDPIPLPDDLKQRFANKTMAIIGYEVDQVRRTAEGDVPVPITDAYNHHYGAWLNSKYADMVQVASDPHEMHRGCGSTGPRVWRAVAKKGTPPAIEDIPVSQFFSEGNGGEMRLSYHGYPKAYAQLLDSPGVLHLSPMQIDTKNREHSGPGFRPGPLPRSARSPPNASYSGLLECPCTTRIAREWHLSYTTQQQGACPQAVGNASECFAAARTVVRATRYAERAGADPSLPPACTAQASADGSIDVFWNSLSSSQACGGGPSAGQDRVVAVAQSVVNLTVDLRRDTTSAEAATITIVGPADVWFGVGFGADSMCMHMQADECQGGGPYAIIVAGDGDEGVTERKLQYHGEGKVLPRSVAVKSNSAMEGIRTVVLTRPLQGLTAEHFTFDPKAAAVKIVNAKGKGLAFSQHVGHASASLAFLAVGQRTCICQGGIVGSLAGAPFDSSQCAPEPRGDLLKQQNPVCSVQTYSGGLRCCIHGHFLLDADQAVPDGYQEYHLKFRFYFEEYVPGPKPSHLNLVRLYYQTEVNAGEYDIVPCLPGVPPQDCIQVITARWKVRDMLRSCPVRENGNDWGCTGEGSTDPERTRGVQLIYAGPHCHAPSCLSMELYNADTGRLLCRMEPTFGASDRLYDERGFVALPPCLWGDPADGLLEPELLGLDTELLSIKRNNNTYGHLGEMASWQMRGVVVPREQKAQVAAEGPPGRLPRRWDLRLAAAAAAAAAADGVLV